MYKVYFYQDKNGKQPVKEYLDRLEKKSLKSKDARIKYNKFDQYIAISRKYGIAAGGGTIYQTFRWGNMGAAVIKR